MLIYIPPFIFTYEQYHTIKGIQYLSVNIYVIGQIFLHAFTVIFYDPVLATAILDRFVHHCHFVVIKGESYRMKQREGVIKAMAEESLPKDK